MATYNLHIQAELNIFIFHKIMMHNIINDIKLQLDKQNFDPTAVERHPQKKSLVTAISRISKEPIRKGLRFAKVLI